ncbi:hypothetical protein DPMN_051012 [Dreissena polymorpha]|uniref:Uncharacterized protein n=1 Tax=Dreissena polymorpha TaxID=45954 RepID=A0A9D4CHT7_DREPO|nr:hypothetical protein DPMN_051012 [Dreissena polymorpha]
MEDDTCHLYSIRTNKRRRKSTNFDAMTSDQLKARQEELRLSSEKDKKEIENSQKQL